MERSFTSSLLEVFFNSFHDIRRSFGLRNADTESHETTVETHDDTEKKENGKLQLIKRRRSDRIDFHPNSLTKVQRIVSGSMNFCSTNKKHGDIFKSHDKAVTVTVYASTSTIHVQGSRYRQWTDEFIEKFKKENNEDESNDVDQSETSLKELFAPNPHMTSTPHGKTKADSCSRDVSSENVSSLDETVAALSAELDLLRARLAKLEAPTTKVTCTVSTQTGKIGVQDMQTMTDSTENVSRHVQCTVLVNDCTTKNDQSSFVGPDQSPSPTGSQDEPPTSQSSYASPDPNPTPSGSQYQPSTPQTLSTEGQVRTPSPQPSTRSNREQPSTAPTPHEEPKPKNTLLIGASILKGIQTWGLHSNVRVKTLRGAHLPRIRRELDETRLDNIGNIVIQAGGNDASSGRSLDEIKTNFSEIIQDIQRRAPHVHIFVSQVLPRVKSIRVKPRVKLDIAPVNDVINSVCAEFGATVIESTKSIWKVCPKFYMADDLHLSDAGTAQLLKVYEKYMYTPVLKVKSIRSAQNCYFCGENGHNSAKCKHGSKVQCYMCGQFGHKSKFCAWNQYPWNY